VTLLPVTPGDGLTLSQAVERAKYTESEAVEIEVAVGTHTLHEPLWIGAQPQTTLWEMNGQAAQGVIVESANSGCVMLDVHTGADQTLVIRNITFRSQQTDRAAIIVASGELLVEDCVIESRGLSCLQVGPSSSAVVRLRRCTFTAGSAGPCVLGLGGKLVLEDCRVNSGRSGIELRDGTAARITGTSISQSLGNGVYAHDGGKVTLERCVISESARAGLLVRTAEALVERCRFNRNATYAIMCEAGAVIQVDADCEAIDNELGVVGPDCPGAIHSALQ
jgi:hypothetical protein